MRKLKAQVIHNLIAAHPTSKEVDFIVWLSRYQNDAGMVRGIYYKSVCQELQISPQSFYNVIRSLASKNIIEVSKEDSYSGDWDISIKDNDYSHDELRIGKSADNYLDMGKDVFYNRKFFRMKANEKLMTMLYIVISGAGSPNYHIGTQNFFDKYTTLFAVKKRALQNYLKSIRKFFSIGIKDRQYWIRPLCATVDKENDKTDKSERAKQVAESVCRRFRLEDSGRTFAVIRKLLEQYTYKASKARIDLETVIVESIRDLLGRRNYSKDPRRWKMREINEKFLHKIFRQHLPEEVLI